VINIVVLMPPSVYGPSLSEENKRKIRAVSRQISLKDASELLGKEQKGDFSERQKLDAFLSKAEIIFARALPANLIKRSPKLKWLQMSYAGMERVLQDKDLVNSPVKLTNASGIQAEAISEYAITLILAFNKHLPHFAQLKQEKKWQMSNMVSLASRTVGVMGLGNIGQQIVKRAKALGTRVIAYDRPRKIMRAQYVDKLVAGKGLNELLRKSDFVISALPSTPATNGLIGEKELRMMKPSAHFINISRGAIVNEKALIRALEEKWIAGAGLDVFAVEPLPKDSKLWKFPNVIISPHCCGLIEDNDDRVTVLFVSNLKRYVEGKRLLNVVNKRWGF